MCRWAISRRRTNATPAKTRSAAIGPTQRKPLRSSGSALSPAGVVDTANAWDVRSASERLVLDAVRLRGVVSGPSLVVLDVLLVVALEPDHLRVALEGEHVGGDTVEEPAIVRDHDGAAG